MKCLQLTMLTMLMWLTGMMVCIWYIYRRGIKDIKIQMQVMRRYNRKWTKQDNNINRFRSELNHSCQGESEAIITQENTPLGTLIEYDGENKKHFKVTSQLFKTFSKEQPFKNFTWKTCAVVGNGGILVNSSCGEEINSAEFVIRCNLPPLGDNYKKDVGNKTDVVTANPSILLEKFEGLTELRRPFVERMRDYGDSLLVLPAFSYTANTPVSLRAVYTLQEFGSPTRAVFFNPRYLRSLAKFWTARGLAGWRLSTGAMVASLALGLCSDVRLYGFWPHPLHPHGCQPLTNHYYDDKPGTRAHNMGAEFEHLLRLHEKGVVKVHLGKCSADPR